MITGILVVLAIVAGVAALACATAFGIALERDDQPMEIFASVFAFGLLAVTLALMWWAK